MDQNNIVPKKNNAIIIPGLVIISVIALVIFGIVSFVCKHSASNSSNSLNSQATIKHYQSPKLGLRFNYISQDFGKNILVKETSDTIYIYYDGDEPTQGQYVRVFTKNQNEMFAQAISRQFLAGYDTAKCFVKSGQDVNGTLPKTGIAAVIAFPLTDNSVDPWWKNRDACPGEYAASNGLAYFWTNQEAAKTFVYLSLGQYIIPGTTDGTSWHTTLELI